MKNKERIIDWLEDIKYAVRRCGSYDPDDQIREAEQMIEDLRKFITENC